MDVNATFMTDSERLEALLADYEVVKGNMNHLFLLVMSAIIFFMQAGFALLEAGNVRVKNVTSILIKNISDMLFGKFLQPHSFLSKRPGGVTAMHPFCTGFMKVNAFGSNGYCGLSISLELITASTLIHKRIKTVGYIK